MADTLKTVIQAELTRLSTEIDKLEEQKRAIEEKLSPAKQEKDYWQKLLALRERTVGSDHEDKEESPITPQTIPENDEYGARGRVMREHILASSELGVTPKTVQEFMRSRDLPVSANYVYKTLGKMKEDGVLESKGGVFRPIPRP